jgi:hypothetical protein
MCWCVPILPMRTGVCGWTLSPGQTASSWSSVPPAGSWSFRAARVLPGQENSQYAMPLDEFVTEVLALLQAQPDAREIQVERVKFLRYGEARGDYDQVVETLNASDPHGR